MMKQDELNKININIIKSWLSKYKDLDPTCNLDNLDWIIEKHESIYQFIKEHYSKPNTIKTHLSTLGKVLRLNNHPEWSIYSEESTDINNDIVNINKEQRLTQTEQTNWLTYNDIIKKRDELKTTHMASLKNHYNYLILCLYTLQPPLRSEWSNMGVGGGITDNFILLDDKVIIINKDKVSSKIGPGVIKIINPQLIEIIKDSLNTWNRPYILTTLNELNAPLKIGGLRVLLKDIFNKPVGTNMLRKAFINRFYNMNPSYKQREHLAHQMRNSVYIAEVSYRKLDKNEQYEKNKIFLNERRRLYRINNLWKVPKPRKPEVLQSIWEGNRRRLLYKLKTGQLYAPSMEAIHKYKLIKSLDSTWS